MTDNKFELPNIPEQTVADQNKTETGKIIQAENAREQIVRENISQSEIANFRLPQNNAPAQQAIRSNEIELKKVENILSQNMENVFLSMDAQSQIAFKQKGEETAKKIVVLLQSGKAKIKKVIDLILAWLRVIPRVNKHFLQQEAKIKADEIMNLYQKNK